jgi:CheY-like chemotaxis protein
MTNVVLLVEDERKTAEMLKEALESEGVFVHWVMNGDDAIDKIKGGDCDLIILDLKLPGMTGDETLEKIRAIDPYVDVIVYTNYQDPPVMQKLINLGVDGYISKGAAADLWETVDKVKKMLDPYGDDERGELLRAIPSDVFKDFDKNN